MHDPAGLRLPPRIRPRGVSQRGRKILAQVLRRPQEGRHGEPEALVLRQEPVLPAAVVRDAGGEGEVLHGAQGEQIFFVCLWRGGGDSHVFHATAVVVETIDLG